MNTTAFSRDRQNDARPSQYAQSESANRGGASPSSSPLACQALSLAEQIKLAPTSRLTALLAKGVDQEKHLCRQARQAAQQGNHDQAIQLLNELIQHSPNNATYYNNRGLLHFQAGHGDHAVQDYNTALSLDPELASVYNNRGNYYAAQGLLEQALADYDQAIDLDPGNIRARINQSITFRDMGWYELAIEGLDLALQLTQTVYSLNLETNSTLEGHLYAERGRTYHLWGDWNYAIADYHRALEVLPSTTPAIQTFSTPLRAQVSLWLQSLGQ